jgi:hypothetical protein
MHASLEEKLKQRYYCEICDVVYISKLYMDNHLIGIRHNNMLKSIKYLENISLEQITKKFNILSLNFNLDDYMSEINSYIIESKKFINEYMI